MKLICPECGREIASQDTNVDTGIAKCVACGEVVNIFQALGLPMPAGMAERVLPLVAQPKGVVVEDDGRGWSARWPWFSPKYVAMLGFCVLWDGFLVRWYATLFSHGWHGGFEIIPAVFPVLHVAAGIWLTYSVVAGFLNSTEVKVDEEVLSVRHWPMPWRGMRVASKEVEQLFVKKKSSSKDIRNANSDYQLCAMVRGTSVNLLAVDTGERGKFLEYWIEKRLGIESRAVAGECVDG